MAYKTPSEILNAVFSSGDGTLKAVKKTDGEVFNLVYDPDSNALKVSLDGVTGGSSIIDGEVSTYADLPAASDHSGEIYVVTTTTGVILINRKQAGMYRSDGTSWLLLDVDLSADKVYYSGSLSSGNVKDALDELKTLSDGKADAATTLDGYGITDVYTKTESDSSYLGKTAQAADSAKLGGVGYTGYVRAWNVGLTGSTSQWIKLCTISTGLSQGSKFTFLLSGSIASYSSASNNTAHSVLDITLRNDNTWGMTLHRTIVPTSANHGIGNVVSVATTGTGIEIWLYCGVYVNISAICFGTDISYVTPTTATYTTTAPTATTTSLLYNTVEQDASTGVVQIPTSGGLSLPNVANSTSNVLDWYEEGTWTPVIYGMTTAGVPLYTAQTGTYTRYGNRVVANFCIYGTFSTAPAGYVKIGGLPFATGSTTNNLSVGSMLYGYAIKGLAIYAETNATTMRLIKLTDSLTIDHGFPSFGTDISDSSFKTIGTIEYLVKE